MLDYCSLLCRSSSSVYDSVVRVTQWQLILVIRSVICWFTRSRAFKFQPRIYPLDGLNTLRYKLVAHEARPLYTWIHIAMPPHPSYFRGTYRAVVAVEASSCQRTTHLITGISILSAAFIYVMLSHLLCVDYCMFTFCLVQSLLSGVFSLCVITIRFVLSLSSQSLCLLNTSGHRVTSSSGKNLSLD